MFKLLFFLRWSRWLTRNHKPMQRINTWKDSKSKKVFWQFRWNVLTIFQQSSLFLRTILFQLDNLNKDTRLEIWIYFAILKYRLEKSTYATRYILLIKNLLHLFIHLCFIFNITFLSALELFIIWLAAWVSQPHFISWL